MAKNHVDRPMKMTVYNSRTDSSRDVTIIPSHNWGGKTLLGMESLSLSCHILTSPLGASIRYCQVTEVIDRVWHVIDITMDSPAYKATLIPLKGIPLLTVSNV